MFRVQRVPNVGGFKGNTANCSGEISPPPRSCRLPREKQVLLPIRSQSLNLRLQLISSFTEWLWKPPKVPDRLMRGHQAVISFVQLFTSNIFIHSEGGAGEEKFLTLFLVICVTRSWWIWATSPANSSLYNSWIWGCRLTPLLMRTTGRLLHWQHEQIRRYL